MAKEIYQKLLIYFAFAQSFSASLGSLVFSEVYGFPPCVLCWYQRIFMYPIVFIIIVGILFKDKAMPYYVLALSLTGMAIAFYHNLLYYGFVPESASSCQLGVSCTSKYIEYLGFITIPFLSLTAFTFISLLMLLLVKSYKK